MFLIFIFSRPFLRFTESDWSTRHLYFREVMDKTMPHNMFILIATKIYNTLPMTQRICVQYAYAKVIFIKLSILINIKEKIIKEQNWSECLKLSSKDSRVYFLNGKSSEIVHVVNFNISTIKNNLCFSKKVKILLELQHINCS